MNTLFTRFTYYLRYTALSLITSIVVASFFAGGYGLLEPMFAQAANSQVVTVTLNVTTGVAVTVDRNAISMSTNLGVAQNTAVGTSTFTVATNDPNGYTFTLAASTFPAMQSGSNNVTDYATTTSPTIWSVPATTALFGFSVIGSDITPSGSYWGSGSFCNGAASSTISTTLKYTGFYNVATTTAKNTSTTTQTGDNTIVCYAVAQGTSYYIPGGTYTATITGTATAN
jgi:hypothetical protein